MPVKAEFPPTFCFNLKAGLRRKPGATFWRNQTRETTPFPQMTGHETHENESHEKCASPQFKTLVPLRIHFSV
jgi:hypothetical protein